MNTTCKHCSRELKQATTKNGVTYWASVSRVARCTRFLNLAMHQAMQS